ncbi:prolyl-tRNA synthetase associated domain-containing protein [Candidatus Peregrinibacteria bacterium]|nr:prolyl-tRNA synthetase associated domain-containing protein [Candidatus Peregrinibacteria bacterium]
MIYDFLKKYGIHYERFDHPAVFTCEESKKLCFDMPGNSTKNLFLRDKDGKRHFLVIVGHEKRVDLKKLKLLLGLSKLSFASEDRLKKYLGVEPGSVTLLGLIHDTNHSVEVIIDEKLWDKNLQCHPLVNTATLVISREGIETFFKITGHIPKKINVPEK